MHRGGYINKQRVIYVCVYSYNIMPNCTTTFFKLNDVQIVHICSKNKVYF